MLKWNKNKLNNKRVSAEGLILKKKMLKKMFLTVFWFVLSQNQRNGAGLVNYSRGLVPQTEKLCFPPSLQYSTRDN